MFQRPHTMYGDLLSITTFDGKTLYFLDQQIRAQLYGGFGAPPTAYQTRRGYQQDGELEVYFTLSPRTVDLQIWYAPGIDRQKYWDNRNTLHEFFRPDRNGPMTLTLKQPNGNLRALVVRANPGLVFPPTPVDNNSWNILEPLQLVAYDPLWFDPTQAVTTIAAGSDTNLVFPITFDSGHIIFGVSGAVSSLTITYPGTWVTYPTITLTGPYSSVNVRNVQTSVSFTLNVAIAAGEQRIITLTPGMQQIVDAFGGNKFGELGPNSDLIDFNIRPDPMVTGGINTLQAQFVGGTIGQSSMKVAYYVKYFAL